MKKYEKNPQCAQASKRIIYESDRVLYYKQRL